MPNEPLRFEMSARTFRCGISISLKQQLLQDIYHKREFYPFSSLPPSIVRSFYKKDAALYKHSGPYYEEVFEAVWRTWYPRRNLHPAIDNDYYGFFCRTMKPLIKAGRFKTQQLIESHKALVKTLDGHEGSDADAGEKLEDTFRWVFVCLGENVAKLGIDCNNGEPVQGESDSIAFTMSVEDAVKTVVHDPERRKATAPTLKEYREKKFAI
ncbi:hypothetical protein PAAG_07758 [Paracoccidioides lutzii Pb01]|uniref:Uncharacterized protein n=1 Tax=Paracoccidioides lutzii (strain ATCC MYA-826 / Pb01) TaxID=502779 RepID=C1HA29_PARBA|nr:hypothetical protein PAAG_07758 [Paracoccidioides lutzii Pb01]EEH37202.2 hypothetical protein PAAG_07758 [Paracoccidioides lutzii Pb01]